MEESEAWRRLGEAGHGVLGSVDLDRGTHLVPVVFSTPGVGRIVIAVDDKPKRTRQLRRLSNIERDSRVTLLVEHYEPDWRRLWWVRVNGIAVVSDQMEPDVVSEHAVIHPQLDGHRLGPWIDIAVERLTGWSAT